MTDGGRRALLEGVLAVLDRQEAALDELVALALTQREALIRNDIAAIERNAEAMQGVVQALDALDTERAGIVHQLGSGPALEALLPLADDLGVTGLRPARERLLARAQALREAQEANAALILNAAKLRERWYRMLAGLSAPTYGAGGRQELRQSRGLVSKSA